MIGFLSWCCWPIACIALYRLSFRRVALDLCGDRDALALPQRIVLIIQAFLKVPALHALAPSVPPSEPPSLCRSRHRAGVFVM